MHFITSMELDLLRSLSFVTMVHGPTNTDFTSEQIEQCKKNLSRILEQEETSWIIEALSEYMEGISIEDMFQDHEERRSTVRSLYSSSRRTHDLYQKNNLRWGRIAQIIQIQDILERELEYKFINKIEVKNYKDFSIERKKEVVSLTKQACREMLDFILVLTDFTALATSE